MPITAPFPITTFAPIIALSAIDAPDLITTPASIKIFLPTEAVESITADLCMDGSIDFSGKKSLSVLAMAN